MFHFGVPLFFTLRNSLRNQTGNHSQVREFVYASDGPVHNAFVIKKLILILNYLTDEMKLIAPFEMNFEGKYELWQL